MSGKLITGVTAKLPGVVGDLKRFPLAGPQSLRIVLPLPPRALSPNVTTIHWAARGRAKAKYRGEAAFITAGAIRDYQPSGMPWKAALVRTTFYFRDRRRRDRDNLLAMLKAGFDGIADSGIVENDSVFRFAPVEVEVSKNNPRVVIVVERIEEPRP